MIIYPAIDLKDGNCVRLLRGDMGKSTTFSDDPASQAMLFQEAGCQWLHVVDLNGAVEGKPVNSPAIKDILSAVSVPVQLGGGIRTLQSVEMWLGLGISRVILGTAAVDNLDMVREAARKFPGKIAVGIDARAGKVATEGWARESGIHVSDLAPRLEEIGIAAIIYTDIDRDGAMQGPSVRSTAQIARLAKIPVIASGGVSSLKDIRDIAAISPPVDGVIIGRALYDRAIDLGEAVQAFS